MAGLQIYGVGKVWAASIFSWNKFKQKAVHKKTISVENYFMHRIPNYFLDTCTKKTSKRVKTIVIKLEIKQKKDKA